MRRQSLLSYLDFAFSQFDQLLNLFFQLIDNFICFIISDIHPAQLPKILLINSAIFLLVGLELPQFFNG